MRTILSWLAARKLLYTMSEQEWRMRGPGKRQNGLCCPCLEIAESGGKTTTFLADKCPKSIYWDADLRTVSIGWGERTEARYGNLGIQYSSLGTSKFRFKSSESKFKIKVQSLRISLCTPTRRRTARRRPISVCIAISLDEFHLRLG